MIRKSLGFFLALCISTVNPAHSGSILSSKGFGIPLPPPDARSLAMGGISFAQPDPISISGTNPAALFPVQTTLLSIRFGHEHTRTRAVEGTASSVYSNFSGFAFVLPFKRGLGLSLQLTPLTRRDYRLEFRNSVNEKAYTKSVQGEGGHNMASLTVYWQVHPVLSLGLSGQYIFGRANETWSIHWDDTDIFTPTDNLYSAKSSGTGWTAGLLMRPHRAWMVGGVFSPRVRLHSKTDLFYGSVQETEDINLQVPGFWGVSVSVIRRVAVWGLEYTRQNWDETAIRGYRIPGMRATQRIAAGVEFYSFVDPFASYWKRMAYRFGIGYQPFFTTDPEGRDIQELWGTIGFGFPILAGSSRLDVGLGFGKRGSFSANGISENLIRMNCTVTVGEKWFSRGTE